MDFAKMLEVFERKASRLCQRDPAVQHNQFHGGLMLNVLLSFAQFERVIIRANARQDGGRSTQRQMGWRPGTAGL